MSKKFIIDTSVIIDNPHANLIKLSKGGKNKLYITEVVLSELDKHKTSLRFEVASSARSFFRALKNSNFEPQKSKKKNDSKYLVNLKYENGDMVPLYIIVRDKYSKTTLTSESVNDSKIREVASSYGFKCITNDISFKIIALSMGLEAESIYWDSIKNPKTISFTKRMRITEAEFNEKSNELGNKLKEWTQLSVTFVNDEDIETGNVGFYLVRNNHLIDVSDNNYDRFRVKPRNIEQKFYANMLESNFDIMCVAGSTGSGKTLLALQEGMRRVKDKNSQINKIVYMRFTVNAEDKFSALGYRKGGESEKLDFFNYPLYSAINFIIEQKMKRDIGKAKEVKAHVANQLNSNQIKGKAQHRVKTSQTIEQEKVMSIKKNELTEEFLKEYNVEFMDIAHARGITIDNSYIIFDEVQNAPNNIVRLIGTRIGENSIGIFMGDNGQVDHPYLSQERNGLVTLLKEAKKSDFVAAIRLVKTVRSDKAKWFEEHIKG